MRALTPLEARTLGVLIEKQHTVPDTYPLSINSLLSGCNQKTARHPVIKATEGEVLTALDGLRSLSLVFEGSGSRVTRYEQNLKRVLNVPQPAVGLLCMLMLRGPQTSSELRINTERLHHFADISTVEGYLDELAEKTPAMVIKLPKMPGARERRWAHLLCGEVDISQLAVPSPAEAGTSHDVSAVELAALKREQMQMAAQIKHLENAVEYISRELGIKFETAPELETETDEPTHLQDEDNDQTNA